MSPSFKKVLQLLLGLAIFALVISFTDYSALRDVSFRLIFFGVVMLCTLGMTATSAFKWSLVGNYFAGEKIFPFYKYYFYLLLGRLTASFGPKDIADFGIRAGSLKYSKKLNLYKSFNSVLFDRLIEFGIAALLMIPGLLFFLKVLSAGETIYAMVAVIVGVLSLLAFLKYKFSRIICWLLNLGVRVSRIIPYLRRKIAKHEILEQNRELSLPNFLILKLVLLSAVKFIFTALQAYFIFLALDLNISLAYIFISLPLIQISFIFAFTPGGLGIFEAGWLIILKLLGLESGDIFIFLVGRRVLTLISVSLVTFLAFIFFTIKNKKPI